MDKYFSVVKKTLNFNHDDVPLTYILNKQDYNRSFTLGIFENTDLIFSVDYIILINQYVKN